MESKISASRSFDPVRQFSLFAENALYDYATDEWVTGPIMAKIAKVVKPAVGEAYVSIEAPKGELGYYLISDGTSGSAYRYHVRSPSFLNLTALESMCLGHTIADVVGILGSLDIVLGEVDR